MASSATPSAHAFIITRELYFCNLHTVISFPTNFPRNPLPTSFITRPLQRLLGVAHPFVNGRRNYQFSARSEHFGIFDDVMTTPSPQPIITQDLHFCNLHNKTSSRTHFQPHQNILKFSMTLWPLVLMLCTCTCVHVRVQYFWWRHRPQTGIWYSCNLHIIN